MKIVKCSDNTQKLIRGGETLANQRTSKIGKQRGYVFHAAYQISFRISKNSKWKDKTTRYFVNMYNGTGGRIRICKNVRHLKNRFLFLPHPKNLKENFKFESRRYVHVSATTTPNTITIKRTKCCQRYLLLPYY